MTSGGVPAIDFGGINKFSQNQPASFRDAMAAIPGSGADWNPRTREGSGSPGACSVSTKCYLPNVLVEQWIMPRLNALDNLRVFLRTAVTGTTRDAVTGAVTSVTAVQRTPRDAASEWTQRLSDELPDWYDPKPSHMFTKQTIVLRGSVFVEATELGDVLATSGLPFLQGIETPHENSTRVLDVNCGQAATLTFYAARVARGDPMPPPAPSHGSSEGKPWKVNLTGSDFRHTWSWRRAFCASNRSLDAVNVGDITQQNLGNDLDTAYLLVSIADARAQALSAEGWRGGVNLTALRMLEERAYGWLSLLQTSAYAIDEEEGRAPGSAGAWGGRIALNRTTSGTQHGLSKMVYWRDTRRAVGVGGFKLLHEQLRDNPNPQLGTQFADAVALGEYNDDTHHLRNASQPGYATMCDYPAYMSGAGEGAKPYYIPLRALMVGSAQPSCWKVAELSCKLEHAPAPVRVDHRRSGRWHGGSDGAERLERHCAGARPCCRGTVVSELHPCGATAELDRFAAASPNQCGYDMRSGEVHRRGPRRCQ